MTEKRDVCINYLMKDEVKKLIIGAHDSYLRERLFSVYESMEDYGVSEVKIMAMGVEVKE